MLFTLSKDHAPMLYVVLGLSLSVANLAAPVKCICELFSWRNANEVMLSQIEKENQEGSEVPKTVAEMRELIRVLKEPK